MCAARAKTASTRTQTATRIVCNEEVNCNSGSIAPVSHVRGASCSDDLNLGHIRCVQFTIYMVRPVRSPLCSFSLCRVRLGVHRAAGLFHFVLRSLAKRIVRVCSAQISMQLA